ncbi:Fpg/Nei family DNA glycosylase [Allokutzneria sp. A3M-2-11 16]|uniref:Fpg/Nei family DNA glycosylase n=1 Tax=Allokutzneria sp. A3M-2-11 16 TaxID=2962043 RepID=UPI0020B835F9|nr:zinc finger domain-containing protein [Allokutzneria sp. A3M-2-11 16]MCP3800911.1 Fpg/Nei family DNA glycosylase [Allokutzneria sp. A3M-2-11 16]
MPEGHTLHRLARLHHKRYAGHEVAVDSPQGRFAIGASLVNGRVFESAEAIGKHLLHHYGPDRTVHVHLGLYGKFAEQPRPVTPPQGLVRMRVIGPTHWTDLRGPTACDVLTEEEVDVLRDRLGPDPLRADADPGKAWRRIENSRTSIAALLMDQRIVAGAGNIFRAEVLYRLGIPPLTPGRDLDEATWKAIWEDLKELMEYGVRVGRIDTVRPEHEPEAMGRAPREDRHGGEVYVYRRDSQPCLVCGTPVATAKLVARNLYWCPTCQA